MKTEYVSTTSSTPTKIVLDQTLLMFKIGNNFFHSREQASGRISRRVASRSSTKMCTRISAFPSQSGGGQEQSPKRYQGRDIALGRPGPQGAQAGQGPAHSCIYHIYNYLIARIQTSFAKYCGEEKKENLPRLHAGRSRQLSDMRGAQPVSTSVNNH